jgi:hypothetical protein
MRRPIPRPRAVSATHTSFRDVPWNMPYADASLRRHEVGEERRFAFLDRCTTTREPIELMGI